MTLAAHSRYFNLSRGVRLAETLIPADKGTACAATAAGGGPVQLARSAHNLTTESWARGEGNVYLAPVHLAAASRYGM